MKVLALLAICLLSATMVSFYKQKNIKFSDGGCGPKSLIAVMSVMQVPTTEEKVFSLFPDKGKEVLLVDIQEVAQKIGLNATPRRMDILQLRKERPLGVLHIDGNHFVGLVGYDDQAIHIAETAYETMGPPENWSDGDLATRWDGVILTLSPHR